MNNRFLSRLTLIGIVMSSASSLIVVQMIHIQNSSKHQELSEKADEEYSYAIENYSPQRGNIYDRWGRLLAGNEDVYEIGRHAGICHPPHCHRPNTDRCQ